MFKPLSEIGEMMAHWKDLEKESMIKFSFAWFK